MLKKPFLHYVLLLQFVSLVFGKSKSYRKKSQKSQLSSGGIAGIVVGVCLVIAVISFVLWKRKQNHKNIVNNGT